jgi:hypothetical protein
MSHPIRGTGTVPLAMRHAPLLRLRRLVLPRHQSSRSCNQPRAIRRPRATHSTATASSPRPTFHNAAMSHPQAIERKEESMLRGPPAAT